jgi:hypothetical protein
MQSNPLSYYQNNTIYNKLAYTWRSCTKTAQKSRFTQISSLFQAAIASLCRQSSTLLTQLFHHNKTSIRITLPQKIEDLAKAFFPLHRHIEQQYRALPWPPSIKNIVIMTDVLGGFGDIAAAAKAIAVMQQISPTLIFDWVVDISEERQKEALSFLPIEMRATVHIRNRYSPPYDETPADFMLVGPVKFTCGIDYTENKISRRIQGPTFGFTEYGDPLCTIAPKIPHDALDETSFQKLYHSIFPSRSGNNENLLPMGLLPGTGVFLDENLLRSPLSRGDCCPSYLLKIQDTALRQDILEAMHSFEDQTLPDYDQYSFNSGYAHHLCSWGKFIDCVALHEQQKQVVIVLNHHGAFKKPSEEEFCKRIFTPKRLHFLHKKGYSTVAFKGIHKKSLLLKRKKEASQGRQLTVIVRPFFAKADMSQLQLSSERLLTTGDNSVVEAWCARCKLYLYEDVGHPSYKWRFLQQQVDLAQTISPTLSRLLALFGGDRRLPEPHLNEPLNAEKMREIEILLRDPSLANATLAFCKHVTANYSFSSVLEAALKRAAWHYAIPRLEKIEAKILYKESGTSLISSLQDKKMAEKTVTIRFHMPFKFDTADIFSCQ